MSNMSNMNNRAVIKTVYVRRRMAAVLGVGLIAGGALGGTIGAAVATSDKVCSVTAEPTGVWDGSVKVSDGGMVATDCGTYVSDSFHSVGNTVTITKPLIGFSHIK